MLTFSQIVVDNMDMPQPGDTLRVSTTVVVPLDFAATAMDTTWDFSMLEAMTQRVDTFVMASSTPSAYQFFFVLLGGANLASPRGSAPIPNFPVTNGYNYYKNSGSSFSELGSAYTVQGAPLPAKYDSPDILYQFPLTPGSSWSSVSAFEIALPDLAYVGIHKERSSVVDGWGTLVTPFGTFETIRVKSMVSESDSVYIDSLAQGISIERIITEYKWLANNQGIPVLQVNEENNMVSATYRDIYRIPAQGLNVSLGPDTAVFSGTTLSITAQISGGTPPYQMLWSTLDTGITIQVTIEEEQTISLLVVDALQNFGSAAKNVYLKYPPGISEYPGNEVMISPNPGSQYCHITVGNGKPISKLEVYSSTGILQRTVTPATGISKIYLNASELIPGVYMLKVTSGESAYTTRLVVVR